MADREVLRYGIEPSGTLWRLSRRKYEAMELPPRRAQGVGRFDDPALLTEDLTGEYGVLYVAIDPRSAFMEALSGLRNNLKSQKYVIDRSIMDVNDRDEFEVEAKAIGSVITSEWQNDWQLTSAKITTIAPVFDLTDPAAVQFVRNSMAITLLSMGLDDLDFSHVLSDNRELTRAISRWIWSLKNGDGQPLFSGIRYRSRFDPECICLALYEGRSFIDGDIDIQPVTSKTPGLAEAAHILRLEIA